MSVFWVNFKQKITKNQKINFKQKKITLAAVQAHRSSDNGILQFPDIEAWRRRANPEQTLRRLRASTEGMRQRR
jgi:hypothetical protein